MTFVEFRLQSVNLTNLKNWRSHSVHFFLSFQRQYFPSFRLALAAVLLIWYLAVPSSAGVILTGVAPNYEPEQPTFMYTNFGVIFGTRDFMKQFQFHSATDDFNHRHKDLIGTSGRIRENVTPYQGDPKRATRYTAGVNHNEQNRKR
ncbi:hypothetical protein HPB48_021682 [Haemaphysalis longicornis]|uniref:Uncharacterized protein n=1 Tax=Haemaphysalis longicornis TaxID=44386 RepID=A0A9J6FZ45_HAELO|nr:hypothetical protein HPB48_021682 [Haemaphysalis longicornis]